MGAPQLQQPVGVVGIALSPAAGEGLPVARQRLRRNWVEHQEIAVQQGVDDRPSELLQSYRDLPWGKASSQLGGPGVPGGRLLGAEGSRNC